MVISIEINNDTLYPKGKINGRCPPLFSNIRWGATPDNRHAGLKPSSWDGVTQSGEHGWSEIGGDEGNIRKMRAWAYTLNQYVKMLPRWLEICSCYCPPK